MNKNQGTTIGAVLLAAFLFKGSTPTQPDSKIDSSPGTSKVATKPAPANGPWMASCSYWAPERTYTNNAGKNAGSATNIQGTSSLPRDADTILATDQPDRCEGSEDIWGLPGYPDGIGITSIIAIVPDPVVTSTPLKYDRNIDALINAAARRPQHYQSSFYWLPWQQPTAAKTSSNDEPSAPPERNTKEPGLIIFRATAAAGSANSDVLYVFLVGETPTTGIDGIQMQRAITYRKQLLAKNISSQNDGSSVKADDRALYVVGPTFSGSALSISRALKGRAALIRGATGTPIAAAILNEGPVPTPLAGQVTPVRYQSFADNNIFSQKTFISKLAHSGVPFEQIAVLVEGGTTLGSANAAPDPDSCLPNSPNCYMVVQFPRNIFLLRNAYGELRSTKPGEIAPPSPYLQLKLKGTNANDDLPNFDAQMTPLSQEAQLMTIQRQLQRYHTKYILIWGSSNVLDQFFLAQYFHRALPDARIIFNAGDLLIEREVDNTPFVGTLTVNPYQLIGLGNPQNPGFGGFAFPNSDSDAYFNAATSILCEMAADCYAEEFAGYKPAFGDRKAGQGVQPPLWVTATGSDGYYPLGLLNQKASDNPFFMPPEPLKKATTTIKFPLHPSRTWIFLCSLITLACLGHAAIVLVADYWSPFTRCVAVRQNDDPERLCVYLNIGTVALVSMSWLITWPFFVCVHSIIEVPGWSYIAAVGTSIAGIAALVSTLIKTGPVTLRRMLNKDRTVGFSDMHFYRLFHWLALFALVAITAAWAICCNNLLTQPGSNAGMFFAYRCLNPQNGISPITPILIVLATWYVWAIIHTLRHRFTPKSRPLLPTIITEKQMESGEMPSYALYVSDEELTADHRMSSYLVNNLTGLLITREVILRFVRNSVPYDGGSEQREKVLAQRQLWIHRLLFIFYAGAFLLAIILPTMHSLDSLFWRLPDEFFRTEWQNDIKQYLRAFECTPFELLNRALFFPLLVISVTSWLRMVLVWGSLKRGVLQPLEYSPLRFAFDSLKGAIRLSLFRQSGLREQWKDMSRSTESIRQLLNDQKFDSLITNNPNDDAHNLITRDYEQLNSSIRKIINHLQIDHQHSSDENRYMLEIEKAYQVLSTNILRFVLIPYWWRRKHGIVESTGERPDLKASHRESKTEKEQVNSVDDIDLIQAAEEFLAIRYLALIRVVLVNLRFLMIFVPLSFVLTITAWNSYPFQPRQFINLIFTLLLFILGTGTIVVLAQMYRDPLLSRITNTASDELGWDFFLKVASLGALPVLSWLAYNYPEVGTTLFRIFQPGVGVMK